MSAPRGLSTRSLVMASLAGLTLGCWDGDTSLGALGTSATGGGGGAATTTVSSSGGAGGGGATGSTSSASTSSGGQGGTGAGGGGDPCVEAYPLGPYGQAIGDVWDPQLTFPGYPEGSLDAGTIDLTTYHDPHFCEGAGAVVVYEFAQPDATASARSGQFVQNRAPGGPWEGVHIVELLVLGKSGFPAGLPDALDWKTDPGVDWAIGIDAPPADIIPEGFQAEQVVIDPCTMKVVMRLSAGDIDQVVTDLASRTECPP